MIKTPTKFVTILGSLNMLILKINLVIFPPSKIDDPIAFYCNSLGWNWEQILRYIHMYMKEAIDLVQPPSFVSLNVLYMNLAFNGDFFYKNCLWDVEHKK